MVQSVRARADDAAVDHEFFQLKIWRGRFRTWQPIFEAFQNIQSLAGEGRLEAVRESDEKPALITGWSPRDDTNRAARMNQ